MRTTGDGLRESARGVFAMRTMKQTELGLHLRPLLHILRGRQPGSTAFGTILNRFDAGGPSLGCCLSSA